MPFFKLKAVRLQVTDEPSAAPGKKKLAKGANAKAKVAHGATGATLLLNQDAPDQTLGHLHLHVIPRLAGDGFRIPEPDRRTVDRAERAAQAATLRSALGD